MEKIEILKLVSKKTDWELYELKDERILRLDKYGKGKEIYDSVHKAFDELKEYYRDEVDTMISDNSEVFSSEIVELHKHFLSDDEIQDMITTYKIVARTYVYSGNPIGFNKIDLVINTYNK